MRRPLIISAIAGAILAAAVSPAAAASGDYVPQAFETPRNGTGSADADAEADAFGNLSASSSAIGGTKKRILFGSYSTLSSGVARAQVNGGGDVIEGVYEVTVTFADADTDEAAAGNGQSRGSALVTAYNGLVSDGQIIFGSEAAELPSEPGTLVVQFEVTILEAGSLGISAEIQSQSSATGRGNTASTESSAQAEISFARVG